LTRENEKSGAATKIGHWSEDRKRSKSSRRRRTGKPWGIALDRYCALGGESASKVQISRVSEKALVSLSSKEKKVHPKRIGP